MTDKDTRGENLGIGDLLGGILGGRGGTGSGGLLVGALLNVLGHGMGTNPLLGLLEKLGGAGLGEQAQSWVGTGDNRSVTGDQLRQALGDDTLDRVAREAGVTPDQAADDLAQTLPPVVDRLTPEGRVPEAASLEELIRRQSL
ncbi:YidB family protein [Streptomyces sp. enrichment culture]|uniref:YidB family protein n=1 Tax=Streptomyces sp. enrichment culture TaxID=1795815 RepID=UPI003F559050